ncbi:hypothetical protein ESCO_005294 [Escovopsis weberi]|uniref:DUF7730 domain-containing protein n=1 Tax=Escovopsis weberi TaxID=150374 RepID=A0A0N0RTQ1_ESCWE|nr:hypothetical protein ESCO_005294 [Escovopsis weberi]
MAETRSSSVSSSKLRHSLTRLESWLASIVPSRGKTSKSPLFTRIPPEIRRQILIYAFGDWTVHLGLKCQRVRRMFRRPTEKWTWKGCFCHQRAVTWHNPPHFEGLRRSWYEDRCFEDCRTPSQCFLPFDCRIGIMGWLLSCRQAYQEGVDVLYGTNTIHVHGFVLLRQLPDVLTRARLESIVKVELTWHMNPWLDRDGSPEPIMEGPSSRNIPTMEAFVATAETLPRILPNIKYLYISLVGGLIPFNVSLNSPQTYHTTEELLRVVDRAVRGLEGLAQCRIALPTSCFHMWKFRIPHIWDDTLRSLDMGGVWRDLPPPEGEQWKADAACKGEPEGQVDRKGRRKGYWVCHGKYDLPVPFVF